MSREPQDPSLAALFQETGRAVSNVGSAMMGYRSLLVDVTGFTVRGPDASVNGDFLLTVRGVDANGMKVVAFHSDSSLEGLMVGFNNRLNNGGFKWREDQWAR